MADPVPPAHPGGGQPPAGDMRAARFDDLDATTLYALLRLRADTFVVEQRCAYPDLDGRDLEAGALHCWIAQGGQAVAYLRLLTEPGGSTRISRVVTAPAARGRGLAGRLLRYAIETAGRPLVADVQSRLEPWYRGFGFRATGAEFVEDGIAHVPMRLD